MASIHCLRNIFDYHIWLGRLITDCQKICYHNFFGLIELGNWFNSVHGFDMNWSANFYTFISK